MRSLVGTAPRGSGATLALYIGPVMEGRTAAAAPPTERTPAGEKKEGSRQDENGRSSGTYGEGPTDRSVVELGRLRRSMNSGQQPTRGEACYTLGTVRLLPDGI